MDTISVVNNAYDIADLIKVSAEAEAYIASKRALENDEEAQNLIREFEKKKEFYEECRKYGIFHPDFQQAKADVKELEEKLAIVASIQRFKAAEQSLDDLLHEVSETIAHSVSETIKVPSNDPMPKRKKKEGPCGGF